MTVALSMIVRNEEANLGACLASVRGLFDDLVVVDTGSTDRTVEIARSFGARVFHFPWCDDFAVARNFGLYHTTADWVFWLDADDRLAVDQRRQLGQLLCSLDGAAAYTCKIESAEIVRVYRWHQVRLWPHRPEIRWRGRVHEQLTLGTLPSVASGVTIEHTGYQDAATLARKLARNERLIRMGLDEAPDDPKLIHDLFRTLGVPRNG